MENPEPTSHFYISQRLRLHYLDWGNPDKPMLLLIHGGMDHARNWDWLARAMREDWHIIAVDLRGHGDSEWSNSGNYRIEDFMLDLDVLLDHLGISSVDVIAHSLGGNIAVRYAGFYPDKFKRLISIEGLGFSPKMHAIRMQTPIDEQYHEWFDSKRSVAQRQPRRYASIEDACLRMQEKNTFLSEEQARHLTEHGLTKNPEGGFSWKFDKFMYTFPIGDLPVQQIQYLWGRISCPTFLAYGADSFASNPEQDGRMQYFTNARLKIYDNAGHWLHHDRLEDFVADAKAFLSN